VTSLALVGLVVSVGWTAAETRGAPHPVVLANRAGVAVFLAVLVATLVTRARDTSGDGILLRDRAQ